MHGKLFLVSASSGAGKTTLVRALLEKLQPPYALHRVVTYTTRVQRTGEKAGDDYHFISVSEFEQKITQGFFLEWSNDYGDYYGCPVDIVHYLDSGISYIAIVDLKGAQTIVSKLPQAVSIWIGVNDITLLQERLCSRNTENEQTIAQRIHLAMREQHDKRLDLLYKYQLFNHDFEKALNELYELIVKELESNVSNMLISRAY